MASVTLDELENAAIMVGDGYERFSKLLEERGVLDSWYRFRQEEEG